MKKCYMILDLQYGSTGKGLLAGYLAKKEQPDTVVTAWGPNAGHTYIDPNGRQYIHRMLANGIVSPNLKAVLIGPGSVIDIQCLQDEITSCADIMKGKAVIIHPQAVIVNESHRETEKRNVKIGSTMKGTGAAVIERIERNPENNPTASESIPDEFWDKMGFLGVAALCGAEVYRMFLEKAEVIQIEGAQGYSLSIYHGFYPYTTSRDVTPAQVMADCAIPYGYHPEVYGTLRTYPIRVANRYDEGGKMIGTSGPCHIDQQEIKWEDIGLEPELTTVTKLPRRIFTFSMMQLMEACFHCSPDKIFLNFVNYLDPEAAVTLVDEIECQTGIKIEWIGVGPTHHDVVQEKDFHYDSLEAEAEEA